MVFLDPPFPFLPPPQAAAARAHGLPHGAGAEGGLALQGAALGPWVEKNHVVPTAWQDEALARDGVSREVPCSALNPCASSGKTCRFHTQFDKGPETP